MNPINITTKKTAHTPHTNQLCSIGSLGIGTGAPHSGHGCVDPAFAPPTRNFIRHRPHSQVIIPAIGAAGASTASSGTRTWKRHSGQAVKAPRSSANWNLPLQAGHWHVGMVILGCG